MKDKKIKIVVYLFAVMALVSVGWYFCGDKNDEFKLITNDEELGEFMTDMKEGDLEKYLAKRDELYAQDTYGGDTPEETLELFIKALKAGDVELASKYFRLEDQEKELGELKLLNENQAYNYINMLQTGSDKYCDDEKNECEINGTYKDVDILVAKFIQNPQTNKWKI